MSDRSHTLFLENALRLALAGKPLPSMFSTEMDQLMAAIGAVVPSSRERERLGLFALTLILQMATSSMLAERELALLGYRRDD